MFEEEKCLISQAFKDPRNYKYLHVGHQTRVSKSNMFSEEARNYGNKLFKSKKHDLKDHEEIWQKYSLSIAVADVGSEHQALGYANRSAFLMHLSKYEEASVDIDRAITITKLNSSKVKWLCRKVKCLAAANLPGIQETLDKAKSYLQKIKDNQNELKKLIKETEANASWKKQDKESELKDEKQKPEIKKSPNDFTSVTAKYNSTFGKHLIATQNIKAGEVIFVESPLVSSLNLFRAHAYCSHCFIECWNMIPCDCCSWCMYCSETCKEDAWKQYHNIECPAYGYFIKNDCEEFDDFTMTSLRLLIKECQKAGSVTKLKALLINNEENLASNLTKNDKLQGSNFKTVLYLNSILATNSFPTIFSSISIRMLMSLAKFTTLFGKKFSNYQFENSYNDDDVLFIGSLFLRLLTVTYNFGTEITNNSIFLSNYYHLTKNSFLKRGYCLTSYFCLINHSCNSNVSKCFTEDNKLVVYALQPIKKNEQLFYSYADNTFYEKAKSLRQSDLKSNFNFYCKCNACNEDWLPILFLAEDMIRENKVDLAKRLFQRPLEFKLYKKHEDLIMNLLQKNNDFNVTEKMVQDLIESVSTATKRLSQPKIITSILIEALKITFERVYAGCLRIPEKCKNK